MISRLWAAHALVTPTGFSQSEVKLPLNFHRHIERSDKINFCHSQWPSSVLAWASLYVWAKEILPESGRIGGAAGHPITSSETG